MKDRRQSDEPAPGGAPSPHAPRHPGRDPARSVYAESDTELLQPELKLVCVGFTHRTAPLALRARFAVPRQELPGLARRFRRLPGVGGCVVVATCNRLEAYLEIRSEAEAEAAFVDLVGGADLEGRAALARSLFVRGGAGAVRHLFRVCSGVDAMVLGDAQILGQAKEAYSIACAHETAGPMLHKAFHAAFRCAKAVRSDTTIGAGNRTVAGAAVSLLARRLGGLRGKEFLLVGVNEMTAAAGARLRKGRAARLLLCNRTAERARELAATLRAEAVPWSALAEAVAAVDAVVTCTGAAAPLFTRAALAAAQAARPERPLVVADIAVPPDVEPGPADAAAAPAAAPSAGPLILDLEDVSAYQARSEQRRCTAAGDAERMVLAHVETFLAGLRNQLVAPKLERLRAEADELLARELQRLPADLSTAERGRLEELGRTLIKRCMGLWRRIEDES